MSDEAGTVLTEPHTLLFVDDEENILNSLRRLFRREPYKILTTVHAREGLEMARANAVSLVISDHRMPEMEGTEFLARLREVRPEAVRIMLTGYADINAATDAINRCEVYRFIAKPWNDEDLKLTVRGALRMYELTALNREMTDLVQKQNQELYDLNRGLELKVRERTAELEQKNGEMAGLYQRLETGFMDTVRVMTGLIELKSHYLAGRVRRVAVLSRETAGQLGLSEADQAACEMAALLMDVGTIGYPDELLRKSEEEMSSTERSLFRKHSLLSEAGLKGIERLDAAARIVRSHHERFDGKGFPDGLEADRIPMPARIVAAADFYDSLIHPPAAAGRRTPERPLEVMEKERGGRFDPAVVNALVDLESGVKAAAPGEAEISVWDLKEGMKLSRNLVTSGGILLLPAGSVILPAQMERIRNFHRIDPIVERIFVMPPG